MADDETDLDAEITRQKAQAAEQALIEQLDQEASGDETAKPETPKQAAADEPASKRKTPNYVLTPVDVPKAAEAAPPLVVPTPTPESPSAPADIKTDPETGTPYVEDQGTKIPHAELATPADKEAFPPTDVTLPQVDVTGKGTVAPAPDQLDQVERATLVKAPAPDLGERGAPIPEAPEVRRAVVIGTTPKAQPAIAPPPAATPIATKARASEFGYTPDEYKAAASGELTTTTQAPAEVDTGAGPPMMNAPNGQAPAALIIHHTSGRNSADSVVDDWRTHRPGVGAQMIMDRDGTVHNTQQEFGYGGTGNFLHSVIPGVSNRTAVGIEVIANDDADMTPAQLSSLQRLAGPKGPYVSVPVYGHSQVSPGDRDNEGVRGVAAINEARQGGQVSGGPQVAAGPQNYITGRATTFGYKDKGDVGVGATKLGQLSTNNQDLVGLAIPEEALKSYVSAHPADWRKARVEVVDPNGKSVMVPIVDLGPRDTSDKRGVITDFTQGLTNMLGNTGEENYKLRIIPNAGPDVMRDPQAFADEQAAIKAGQVKAPPLPGAAKARKLGNYVLSPVSQAEQASADTATQFGNQGQRDNLSILADQTPNLGALIKRLDQPVDGVNDAVRKDYQAQVKKEATAYAQDYYKEPDPQKAYDRITSNVGPAEFAGEVISKIVPNFGKADVSISRFMDSADEKRVKQFIDALGPNASPDVKTQEMQRLVAASPEERGPLINTLISHADPAAAQAIGDPGNVLDSLNRVTDQDYQAKRQAAITEKQNWVAQSLRTDPRMVGTPAEFVTQQLAALPKNVVEAMLPPGVRETAFYSEIYQDAKENFARDNPRMSPEELDQKANLSAIAQLVPQEVLMAAVGGKLGAIASRIENPVARVATSALAHTAIGAAAGGGQQLAANVVEGTAPLTGTGAAALGGAIQSLPGGVVAGFHRAPVEVRAPAEAPVEAPPPEAPPEPAIGPKGEPARGPDQATLEKQTQQIQEPVAPPQEPIAPPQIPQEASIHEPQLPEIDESMLSQQAADLYRRHQAELALAKGEAIPAEARTDEPVTQKEVRTEEPQPVRDFRDVTSDAGRESPTSGQDVSPQLGRVQSTLDAKLSPTESAAFEPDREALRNTEPGTPEFTQAYRDLREKVISRFQPILDALGVRRLPDDHVEPGTGATHAFAAGRGIDDRQELHTHLNEGAGDIGRVMEMGADPAQYLHSVVQEEIIHFAQSAAMRDEWAAKGGHQGTGKDPVSYEKDRGAGLVHDAVAARDTYRANGDHKHADLIDQALINSIRAYNTHAYPTEISARQHLDRLLSDRTGRGNGNLNLMSSELVRQLTQAGAKEPMTESHFKSWWQAAGNFYKKALQGLMGLYRKLGPQGALGKLELAKMIRTVRSKIDALDKLASGEKITPEEKRAVSGPSPFEAPRRAASTREETLEEAIQRRQAEVTLRGGGAEVGKTESARRYDGAPPGVKDSRSLRGLKDRLMQMAGEGQAFRHWYTEGAEPMMRGVGNDPARFERLMANIAATSPQNRVYPNFGMAVRGLAQQEAGGRRITVGKGEQMKERLAMLGRGESWPGVKTNQFYRDHMAVFDQRLRDDMGSTMDMHMARALGYPTDGFTPKQSQWGQQIMREVTHELGWGKPKETQAAIWSAIKARFESVWPEFRNEAAAKGDFIRKTTPSGVEKGAFKDAATELRYRNRALKEAMRIPAPDLSEAAFNFGDALKRDTGAISYETRPSSDIQEKNPWMKQMTPEDWDEYHQQQAAILHDPDGTNKLAKATNLISVGEHQGYSAWGTERNLSQQIDAVMPKASGIVLERAGQKWKVDPTVEHQVKDFAATVGLLYQQDGVGWHRPYFDAGATKKESNGILINAGRALTKEETSATVTALEKHLPSYADGGAKGWFVAPEARGLRIVAWGHDDNNIVHKAVRSADKDIGGIYTAKLDHFVTYGNLLENNWKENPNGDIYRRWLTARRRPDLQRLVDDTLRPQAEAIDRAWAARKSGEAGQAREAGQAGEVVRAQSVPSGAQPRPPPPGPLKDRIAEKLRGGVRWFGQTFKSGESAMLDHPETEPLALAMRRRPSLEQQFGQRAQVMQLADAFNAVPGKERARVVKEFTDYVRAEQNKQPLPAIGADTQKIIAAGKNTLEQLGQISKELNVHVKTSDGKVRPMRLIGRDYFPRMISDDTRDIFNRRDDTRAAEFNDLVNRQIAQGKVKSRDEFIDKFAQAITPDPTSNGHFGNIEKAREAQLPLDFYDFSPEALVKYANRSTSRLSQIAAFGQKLSNKGKDLFDHSIDAVQKASGYNHEAKQTIINRIGEERKAEYAEREKTNLGKLSSLARTATSGAFLGNPITSMYNLIGGAGQNLTFGGPGAFAKTAAHFASIKGAMDSMKEARERNILKSNLSNVLTDYDLVTNQGWATKGVQGFTHHMLNWGGQNLSEGLNRAFAMQQGKYILQRFARGYGQDNAGTRSLNAMINRRGVHDLAGLARERGQGPLTDEFLRQYVMDVHGNYGPSQSASHIFDSPTGKILLQFQKWGANTQRMATREFLMPLARAAKERRPADFAYHLMRNIGYLGAAVGTGGASQLAANFLRDKDPRKPSIGEIYTRFAHGDNWKALQYALQRAQDMVILSGFAGSAGNYSDLANQLTGSDPGGRVKDPLHPPVVSFFQPFQELIQGWHGEGGAAPSPKILDQFAQNILSAYRVGKQTLLTGTNALGIKLQPGEEMAAKNDLSFLRSRVKMFEDENPEFKAKADLKGTQAMSFAGRSQFDPYKDRIQNALLTGHAEDANLAVADWLDRFPPGEQEARRKAIQQSVGASSPIKPGGSYKLESELTFLDWAKQNLPPEEARKIFATARTYAKTAMDTGIMKSKTLAQIAQIDYDKFVYTTPKAKVTVVTPSGGPSLADQIRKEVAAKRLMLQTH